MRRLLEEARGRAAKILNENRDLLNRLAALLIATEVIDGDELKAYVEKKPIRILRRSGRSPSRRRPWLGPAEPTPGRTRGLDTTCPADARDRLAAVLVVVVIVVKAMRPLAFEKQIHEQIHRSRNRSRNR